MSADQLSHETTRPSSSSGQDRERLRADVERARAQLGETVAALASKADVKARAKNATRRMKANLAERAQTMIQTGRQKVSPTAKHARPKAGVLSANGRTASTPVRVGAVAGGVAAGGASVAVLLRRRRGRPSGRWQQTVRAAQQAGEQLRGKAMDIATAIKDSDLPARAATQSQLAAAKAGSRARATAASPAAKVTAQAAVPVVATMVTAWWLRRRRVRRR